MNDTSTKMEEKFSGLMRQKSGEERLRMGFSMYDMARQLVTESIRNKTPQISAADLKKSIFLRFYGDDFDPEMKTRILRVFD